MIDIQLIFFILIGSRYQPINKRNPFAASLRPGLHLDGKTESEKVEANQNLRKADK